MRKISSFILTAACCTGGLFAQTPVKVQDSTAVSSVVADSVVAAPVSYTLSPEEIPARVYYGSDWNTVNTRAAYSFDPNKTYLLPLDSAAFFFPAKGGAVISPYGSRSGRMHTGTDYKQNSGDPIYAAWDGVVRMAKSGYYGYGGIVVIRHENGLETFYAHLSKIIVSEDQWVDAGSIIGLGGSTGRSTGPHLHFETRYKGYAFDPEWLIDFHSGVLRHRLFVLKKKYLNASSNYVPEDEQEEIDIIEGDTQDKEEAAKKAEAERKAAASA